MLLEFGYGLTNAARRTTRGSSELRRADFAGDGGAPGRLAGELGRCVIAFVGKAAYEGTYRERPQLGLQERRLGDTLLFVLPSTSPANAAVPWEERLRWFRALHDLLEPPVRRSSRAVVLDERERVLLYRFVSPEARPSGAYPAAGSRPARAGRKRCDVSSGRRSASTTRLWALSCGHESSASSGTVSCARPSRYYLVRAEAEELTPELAVETEEGMHEYRWWTLGELASSDVVRWPTRLAELLEDLLEHGPPARPIDAGA